MKFSPWIPLSAFQGRSHNWQKVGAGAKNGEGLGPEPELTTGQGRNLKLELEREQIKCVPFNILRNGSSR